MILTSVWLFASCAAAMGGLRYPAQPALEPRALNLSAGLNVNEFGPFCFDQKISHFEDVGGTFCQRYAVSSELYRPGGPVLLRVHGERMDIGKCVRA